MFNMQNGFGIPLPHLLRMQTHQAVLEGISMCGSRKYPYPPPPLHRRDRIFQNGGGVNLSNFPVGRGRSP